MYQMGGLKKEMKLTYIAMLIGGLSLAGLIPLSGFWSKDMILTTTWETGNYIPLLFMVVTAILTAAYTIRMINLVFWGESRRNTVAHKAPWQMAAPLVLLAIGTIVSWIGIGFLTRAYASFGLSKHGLTLSSFISETFQTPVVWISLAAFLIGIGLFMIRKRYAANKIGDRTVIIARQGYGFDTFYGWIIQCLRGFSTRFRKTHTGDLNYNIAGIALGFLILLIILFFIGGM
jgi:NADH:ubiquinone oxidoreductase subunit 5 (subunit L)/multisubunit Na+/H+ antiporter MnhA subunit